MKYYQQIAELLCNGEVNEFFTWVQSFDLLDQVAILRQAKELFEEIANDHKDNLELAELVISFEEYIDNYQESILSELLAKQQMDMAAEKRDKALEELDRIEDGIREYVIRCIVTNADNATAMRKLADEMIQIEKESGMYDPENWKEIL